MARTLTKETVSNVSDRFTKLRAAVVDIRAEQDAMAKGIEAKSLTSAGMRDATTRIMRLQNAASEHAEYLASVLRVYLSSIGARDPEAIAKTFGSLSEHIDNIVECVNERKDDIRESAKESRDREIREAAERLLKASKNK